MLRYATLNILTTCATLSEAEDHSATGLAAQTRLETANGVRLRLTLCLTRSALGLRLLPALVARCTSRTSAGSHHAKYHKRDYARSATLTVRCHRIINLMDKWHAVCLTASRSRFARWCCLIVFVDFSVFAVLLTHFYCIYYGIFSCTVGLNIRADNVVMSFTVYR